MSIIRSLTEKNHIIKDILFYSIINLYLKNITYTK